MTGAEAYAEAGYGEQPAERIFEMAQAFVGDVGTGTVKMVDKDGRATDDWNVSGGMAYESSNPAVATIEHIETTPDLRDARAVVTGVGTATLTATFDGTVDELDELITLAATIEGQQPPPGHAVGGTFEFVWERVPTPPE